MAVALAYFSVASFGLWLLLLSIVVTYCRALVTLQYVSLAKIGSTFVAVLNRKYSCRCFTGLFIMLCSKLL